MMVFVLSLNAWMELSVICCISAVAIIDILVTFKMAAFIKFEGMTSSGYEGENDYRRNLGSSIFDVIKLLNP